MEDQWHYIERGQQFGPVSYEQLKHLATSGQIQPSDMIRREGSGQWVVAHQFKGFFSVPISGTPPHLLPYDDSEVPRPLPSENKSDTSPPLPSPKESLTPQVHPIDSILAGLKDDGVPAKATIQHPKTNNMVGKGENKATSNASAVALQSPKKKRRKREANLTVRILGIGIAGLLAVPCAFGIAMLAGRFSNHNIEKKAKDIGENDVAAIRAGINAARSQIGLFKTPLQTYRMTVGSYPLTLDALRAPPADLANPAKWDGPYLDLDVPLDPWGNLYHYRSPGVHNPADYDVWSVGPDGVNGTKDDIGNWSR